MGLRRVRGEYSNRTVGGFIECTEFMTVFWIRSGLRFKHGQTPIRGDIAYQILLEMGPKLDKDLVREFHVASALRFEESA